MVSPILHLAVAAEKKTPHKNETNDTCSGYCGTFPNTVLV